MLTKFERELERQASVVKVREKLPVGSWMRRSEVLDYCYHRVCRPTLAHLLEELVSVQTSNLGTEYLPTSEIKNIMTADLFREMECYVSTVLVLNK